MQLCCKKQFHIPLKFVKNCDTISACQGCDVNDIYMHVHDVLLHCREHGLVVSKKKLGTSLLFTGFVVSDQEVKPDPW